MAVSPSRATRVMLPSGCKYDICNVATYPDPACTFNAPMLMTFVVSAIAYP